MEVDVRKRGKQSHQLIRIRDLLGEGVQISHILNVNISNEPIEPAMATAVRTALTRQILNVQHTFSVPFGADNFPATLTWRMDGAGKSTAYYYLVLTPFNDVLIARHVKLMLTAVANAVRMQNAAAGHDWGLAYLISRPLSYDVHVPEGAGQVVLHPEMGAGGAVEDDDGNDENEEM